MAAGTMQLPPAEAPATEAEAVPAAFGEAWEAVACSTFEVADALAAQADCGYVTVQENHATNGERTIRVAVARVRSTADAPGAPVFLATGGPGGPGFGRATPDFLNSFAGILADRMHSCIGRSPFLSPPAVWRV